MEWILHISLDFDRLNIFKCTPSYPGVLLFHWFISGILTILMILRLYDFIIASVPTVIGSKAISLHRAKRKDTALPADRLCIPYTLRPTRYLLLATHYSYINITVLKAEDPSLLFFQSSRPVVQSPSRPVAQSPSPVSLPAHSPTRPSAPSHPRTLTPSVTHTQSLSSVSTESRSTFCFYRQRKRPWS